MTASKYGAPEEEKILLCKMARARKVFGSYFDLGLTISAVSLKVWLVETLR